MFQRIGEPNGRVLAISRCRIEQHLAFVFIGAPGDEIDDAAQCGRAIKRRRGSLDDLHLGQIQRWNLEKANRTALAAVKRKTVRQELRIPSV